jgi:hypothetical protein
VILAKFLTTTGVSYEIEEIIKGARRQLVLVSPYLRVNDRFRQLLEEKNMFKTDIRLIYGKQELSPSEIEWISGLKSIRTSFCKNLHAKCYYNETQGIVTSMNLYEFSEVNNQEIGIALSAANDPELYEAMQNEVERLLRSSEEVTLSVQKVAKEEKKADPTKATVKSVPAPVAKSASTPAAKQGSTGSCIRCGTALPLDIDHPYCRKCYADWKKEGGDSLSQEKYCHWCGKPNKSTLEKPVDYECYKKHLKPLGL